MSRKNNDTFKEVITGLFMLAVFSLLVYFTVIISGVDLVYGKERAQARIAFGDVGGLKERDTVIYRGTKVGAVERIELSDEGAVVTVDIDKSVVLKKNCRAAVRTSSLLGGNYLQLDEGTGEVIDPSSVEIRGEDPSDWMSDFSKVARSLNELTADGRIKSIISNLEATAAKMNVIVGRLERGEGVAGRFLSTDTKAFDDLESTLANAKEVSERMKTSVDETNRILARLNKGEGTFGKLLSAEDSLYDDLKASIASFRKTCESVDFSESKGEVKEVIDEAKKLMASLNEVAGRLERGEGVLGKLTTDDSAYNELSGLIMDIRQIIDNYRDSTPISTFSSLATGAL